MGFKLNEGASSGTPVFWGSLGSPAAGAVLSMVGGGAGGSGAAEPLETKGTEKAGGLFSERG